ncbi:MAG: DUF167 family protein [Candidatus Paceibacterota bacterium]|jgi:hypothetical protein
MRIFVKTRPGAGGDRVEKVDDAHYIVWVKEPPQKGQANKGVIRVLAKYFDKPKSLIAIKSGHTSSAKVVEIL